MRKSGWIVLTALLLAFENAQAQTTTSAAADPILSSNKTVTSPNGNLTYIGPLSNETFTANVMELAKHEWIEVSADLVILKSWDGSIDADAGGEPNPLGPDYLRVGLSDGRTLFCNTFSNSVSEDFNEESRYQSYPSQVPGDKFAAMTGAASKNTLGVTFTRASTGQSYPANAVYHIKFIVPHAENTAGLEVTGANLQEADDEHWGIANIVIRAAAAPEKPSDQDIAKAFEASLKVGDDPAAAFQTLIAGADKTILWIAKNVPVAPISAREAATQLDIISVSTESEPRLAAQQKLADLGPQAEVFLRDARKSAKPEMLAHIDWVIQSIGVKPITDEPTRRVMLATRILEIIGTPEALTLRRKLATGNP